jgi:hypothetical protein
MVLSKEATDRKQVSTEEAPSAHYPARILDILSVVEWGCGEEEIAPNAYHHRHFMGTIQTIEFTTYAALVEQFINEVHALWRIEDEEE